MEVHPLLQEPWAITAEGMALVLAIASRGNVFGEAQEKALAAREGRPLANTRSVTVRDGVAEIPIAGTMFRHADLFSAISGGVSYATLRKDLQSALDDSSVCAILLNVDSPGGEVNGCAELADAIYAARGSKPIAAYVGGAGCSAAYWLASAAEHVYCASTSQLGAIGIVASYVDSKKADEAAGKRTVQIASSQSPDKNVDPTTDRGAALVQERLDAVAEVFIGDVARFRGVNAKTVARDFGRGGVLIGAEAVRVGMADSVGNYESALADMAKRGATAKQKGVLMGQEQEQLAAFGAFEREVFAIAGHAERGAALGALRAMKVSHEQASALTEHVKQLESSTRVAAFNALVKQGMDARQISPAMAGGEWISELRASEGGIKSLTAFLATAPKLVDLPTEQPKPVTDPSAAPVGAQPAFTAMEIQIATNIVGNDPVALQKHLEGLAAHKAARASRGLGR